jgi:hypothetical protein
MLVVCSLCNTRSTPTDVYQAVKDHMKAKRTYEMSSQAISAAQGLVMTLGLLGALWLGVYQVAYDGKSVGKFTTLLVYWAQLQSEYPLSLWNSHTNYCRSLDLLQYHVQTDILQPHGCRAFAGALPDKANNH